MVIERNLEASIHRGLKEIRRRRTIMWVVFILYLPVMVAAMFVFDESVIPYAAWSWMAALAVCATRVSFSKCPRCNKLFHTTMIWGDPWTRRCLHCRQSLNGQ